MAGGDSCQVGRSLTTRDGWADIAVSDELRKLESFLVDEFNKGHKVRLLGVCGACMACFVAHLRNR